MSAKGGNTEQVVIKKYRVIQTNIRNDVMLLVGPPDIMKMAPTSVVFVPKTHNPNLIIIGMPNKSQLKDILPNI